jgi:hypothetical protein
MPGDHGKNFHLSLFRKCQFPLQRWFDAVKTSSRVGCIEAVPGEMINPSAKPVHEYNADHIWL